MNRTPRLHTNALLTIVLTVSSGCSPRDAPAPTGSQSDSAGVTIYENSAAEWSEATAWTLSSEPILTIGAFDGAEEYLLFDVMGVRRLSNGNIVITNRGTHELRFYDPDGTHLRSVGREGDGPGEFRSLGRPWPLGSDSITVWDSGNRRLTVFDNDGELGRSFRLDPFPEAWLPLGPRGILAGNSLLVAATGMPPEGLGRGTTSYVRYSLEGAHLTTLVGRPANETNFEVTERSQLIGAVPYARIASVAVLGNRWYYGSGDSWEIEAYSADGALTHLFRRAEPNRPVTQEVIDEYRDPLLNLNPEQQAMLAQMARSGVSVPTTDVFPETLPAYESFIASDDGDLWVENYTSISEQPSWAVFREDGRYLGVVEPPMGAQPAHIGEDFVLVIWEDDLEVQQVQMYELIKP